MIDCWAALQVHMEGAWQRAARPLNRSRQDLFKSAWGMTVSSVQIGRGWRPAVSRRVPKALVRVLDMCWHHDPTQRWSAARAALELGSVLDNFVEPGLFGCMRKSTCLLRRGTKTMPVNEVGQ